MKLAEKHIGTFLVSIAIFLVFGNMAFANLSIADKTSISNISALQDDVPGQHPLVVDKLSISKVSPTVSPNESLGAGFLGTFYSKRDFSQIQLSLEFNCSYSSTDKRELIFQYLYPFHFFW